MPRRDTRFMTPQALARRANKKPLDQVFRTLRQSGLIARQSFSCCMGCALSQLEPMLAESDPPKRGAVFYHQQDAEYFDGRGKTLMIRFGTVGEDTETTTLALGREVRKVLRDAGIKVTWNGKADHCLEVTLDGEAKIAA